MIRLGYRSVGAVARVALGRLGAWALGRLGEPTLNPSGLGLGQFDVLAVNDLSQYW